MGDWVMWVKKDSRDLEQPMLLALTSATPDFRLTSLHSNGTPKTHAYGVLRRKSGYRHHEPTTTYQEGKP